jgi:uncharacterized protein (TIGR02145 family)
MATNRFLLLTAVFVAITFTSSCSDGEQNESHNPSKHEELSSSSYYNGSVISPELSSSARVDGNQSSSSSNVGQDGNLTPCGNGFFNPNTQFCLNGNTPTLLCGRETYSSYQFCANDKVYDLCSGLAYNPANYICCNNIQYDVNTYGCCNNKQYALSMYFCNGNDILDKCGGNEYSPATQFCNGSNVLDMCGGKEYNPETHYCNTDGNTYSCGNQSYNPITHFCNGNEILYKCGERNYIPSKQFCHNNFVVDKCGNNTQAYDPNLYECRASINPNGIYLKTGFTDANGNKYNAVLIGSQTWAAENLNYNITGSRCSSDNPANCEKYGRLYSWTAALTVCPYGWHLPTNEEWDELINFVRIDNNVRDIGKYMRSTEDWPGFTNRECCKDTYGFAALPGGNLRKGPCIVYPEAFDYVGGVGYWWSKSSNGDYYKLSGDLAEGGFDCVENSSVRCVRD